jgi:AraC family transcriptional regulator
MDRVLDRQRYADRIARVTAHIAAHLDDPLDLARLAAIACFSPFHFHRIYSAMTGETVAGTVRRCRLQRAAAQLTGSSGTIAAIARKAGYGSTAAFARAFGEAYGMPPAAFRRRGLVSGAVLPPTAIPVSHTGPISQTGESAMTWTVSIRNLPPRPVLAMRHTGPYDGLGAAFGRLLAWAGGRGLMTPDSRTYAVYLNDCFGLPPEQLQAEVCLDAPPHAGTDLGGTDLGAGDMAASDVCRIEIPGGRHAVLHHQGPYTDLNNAYCWLYGDWLPQSGEELADRPAFDAYLNDPRTLPPAEWRTDLCLPLAAPRLRTAAASDTGSVP